jgi:hypothetical protein
MILTSSALSISIFYQVCMFAFTCHKIKMLLSEHHLLCDPGATRTPDPQLRRLLLYPTELPDREELIIDYFLLSIKIP